MKLKRFNELHSELPNQISGDSKKQSSAIKDSNENIKKFEEFSEHRLEGAKTITKNSEEKGGDALLTYHHFKVKLPYYEQAVDGNFDKKRAKLHFEDLVDELVYATNGGINLEQIEFQELLGKIEVVGELLIKSKSLL